MIFCKYEFEPAVWESLKKTIQKELAPEKYEWDNCSVVEIGHICVQWGEQERKIKGCVKWEENEEGEQVCTEWKEDILMVEQCIQKSPMYAVDILWNGDIPEEFNQHEVLPSPTGIHSFAGLDYLYTKRFCQFNPDSPYCNVNENN